MASFKACVGGTGVGATLFMCARLLFAQVSEPDGFMIPQPPSMYETTIVASRPRDTMSNFTAQDVTLSGLFAARGEMIDPVKDAKIAPATFAPTCGFTGTLVMRGGACRVDFGWYNVDASGKVPSDQEIYTLIPKEDDSVFKCTVKTSQYATRTYEDFCPLAYNNTAAAQAATPLHSFSAKTILTDPHYKGGQIGLALRGGGSPCTQTKFSEAKLNTQCTTCKPVSPWITTLIYQSTAVPDGYYIAFEDLPVSPSGFRPNNDGDFNDFVYFVSGLTCSGAGKACDTGLIGACAVGRTDCAPEGSVGMCRPAVQPSSEKCDNIDNDCNGAVDDGEGLCEGDKVCVRGQCVAPCGTGEFRCDPGYSCKSGLCVEDACADVKCENGESCVQGKCANACATAVCPIGQQCQLGRCVDFCASVKCNQGDVCEDGLCVPNCACRSCGDGKTCSVEGRCVDRGCEATACSSGLVCVQGQCVDPCNGAVCPNGAACHAGVCGEGTSPTAGTGGSDSMDPIVIDLSGGTSSSRPGGPNQGSGGTAGGRRAAVDPGCACQACTQPASPLSWLASVWLVALLLRRARSAHVRGA